MIVMRLRKGSEEVEVKDFLVNLYKRNGYEEIKAEPKVEMPKAEAPKIPRRTKKAQ